MKSKLALIEALVITYITCHVPGQQFSQRSTPYRLLSILQTDDNGLCGEKKSENWEQAR